tara:strand:+ start:110 stop:385 length:276 start_codon:yes stop_codon:yes gene_type:complete
METYEAHAEYILSAQRDAEFQSTVLWVLFTLFVIAPIVWLIIYIPIAIARQPKCPNGHGSRFMEEKWKKVKEGNITSMERVIVCRECGEEI